MSAEKFVYLTKDLSNLDLIHAVEDLDKDFIPPDSLLRRLATEMYGKDDLASILQLGVPLAMVLANRLHEWHYRLTNLRDTLSDLSNGVAHTATR